MTEIPSGTLLAGYSENTKDVGVKADVRHGGRFFVDHEIDDIGIVKIDVDGFEPQVCRGLAEILKRDRPFVLLELSHQAISEFGNEEHFRGSLYPDARIYEFRGGRGVSVIPFAFRSFAGFVELLIIPAEFDSVFRRTFASRSWAL